MAHRSLLGFVILTGCSQRSMPRRSSPGKWLVPPMTRNTWRCANLLNIPRADTRRCNCCRRLGHNESTAGPLRPGCAWQPRRLNYSGESIRRTMQGSRKYGVELPSAGSSFCQIKGGQTAGWRRREWFGDFTHSRNSGFRQSSTPAGTSRSHQEPKELPTSASALLDNNRAEGKMGRPSRSHPHVKGAKSRATKRESGRR